MKKKEVESEEKEVISQPTKTIKSLVTKNTVLIGRTGNTSFHSKHFKFELSGDFVIATDLRVGLVKTMIPMSNVAYFILEE